MTAAQQIMMAMKPAIAYATWNPLDKGAAVSLSGGNLTLTTTSTVGLGRSTLSKASGKHYWENLIVTAGGGVGIATGSESISNFPGATSASWGYLYTGAIYNAGAPVTTVAAFTVGDVIGFALDAGGNTLGIYKNNTLVYTATLSSNTWFACAGDAGSASAVTANFGASPQAYSPPAGFNPGLYN